MPSYQTIVTVPNVTADEYGSLIAHIRRSNPASSPVLLKQDTDGGFKLFHSEADDPRRPARALAISLTVDVDDPLSAAATTTALLALTMDATGMREHFPSVVEVTRYSS